jgi:hypothetical protein
VSGDSVPNNDLAPALRHHTGDIAIDVYERWLAAELGVNPAAGALPARLAARGGGVTI